MPEHEEKLMVLFFRASIWLAILTSPLLAVAIDLPSQSKVEPDWIITGKGIGRYQGMDKSIAKLKEYYPQLTISYERRISVRDKAMGVPQQSSYSYLGDMVVRQGDEELFRAYCWCEYIIKEKKWRVAQGGIYGLENVEARMLVQPSTTNPQYKTAEDIGVGNSVVELRKSYQSYLKTFDLVFIGDGHWTIKNEGKSYSTYIACFKNKSDRVRDQKLPHLELIGFRLETIEVFQKSNNDFDAKGTQVNTYLKNKFDPNAKIVEVITDYECNAHFRH
jgi:hypothetical protein